MEEVFANLVIDKGLISKTHKELLQPSSKKPNNLIWKMAKKINRHFPKEDTQMAKGTKNFPTSLLIRKMQIKPQWGIISYPLGWLLSKQTGNNTVTEDVEKLEPMRIADGSKKWCGKMGNYLEVPQKIKNRITIISSNPTSVYISKRIKNRISKDVTAHKCSPQHYSH